MSAYFPQLQKHWTEGSDPRVEHVAKSYKLLVGSAGVRSSRVRCSLVSWLVGGRSVVFVFCLVASALRACDGFPRFFSRVTGTVPRTGKVVSGIPWADTAGIVVVAYMDILRALFGMLDLGENASERAHLFADTVYKSLESQRPPQERESRSRTLRVMSSRHARCDWSNPVV